MSQSIEIIEYNPEWAKRFKKTAIALKQTLGDHAIAIDHIGSTAIEGLASKDIVDIQVTITDSLLNHPSQLNQILVNNSFGRASKTYDHIPSSYDSPKHQWLKYFLKYKLTHIHFRAQTRKNWHYAIAFRDHLRSHPEVAKQYESVKILLAKHLENNREAYCEIKNPIFDLIMISAVEFGNDKLR